MTIIDTPFFTTQRQHVGTLEDWARQTKRLITWFEPISLSEMQQAALLDRVDTKYILGAKDLYAALQQLTEEYRVLEIAGVRLNRYQTVYFDTPDFDLYRQHHNKFGTRYKVRTRQYVDSNLAFFEVKHKTNRGRTIKSRLPISSHPAQSNEHANEFVGIHTPLDPDQLEPKLWNSYLRMTFVSKHRLERLTIDLNLTFGWGDAQVTLPGIVIAEVKQKHFSHNSDFIRKMREFGIHPTSFSKYCIGASMLYSDLKANNFKPHLLKLNKAMQEEMAHGFAH